MCTQIKKALQVLKYVSVQTNKDIHTNIPMLLSFDLDKMKTFEMQAVSWSTFHLLGKLL